MELEKLDGHRAEWRGDSAAPERGFGGGHERMTIRKRRMHVQVPVGLCYPRLVSAKPSAQGWTATQQCFSVMKQ